MAPVRLDKERHITYWLRCLKVFLPSAYHSMDSNRMMLACFTLSALDLLDALDSKTSEQERTSYADWIYNCQRPDGGFRGSPSSNLGDRSNESNAVWDPASVAATFFALCSLVILRDDFSRLRRRECLRWLKKLQREDGSFGQTLGDGGRIEGGFDTRFCHTAMVIRWILNGGSVQSRDDDDDVDIDALASKIRSLQAYDGGISDEPFHEPHGGYTFCAVSALSLTKYSPTTVLDGDLLLHWLASRATTVFDFEDYSDEEEDADTLPPQAQELSPEGQPDSACVGFNGRCNKVADTCYAWWVGATLQIINKGQLIDSQKAQQCLLTMTQHRIGGFSKFPDDPPDIYHSYLGLAALSMLGYHDGLKPIHPAACISMDAVYYMQKAMMNSISDAI